MKLALLSLLLATTLASCASVPRYVPSPSSVFPRMTALGEPRSEMPVGALWVQGYGPVGAGAGPDNLVTIRSLSSVAIDRGLQLSLTAGLFDFLGLDPHFKRRVQARFGEISIVRVKDVAALGQPADKPRLYEALKAATITITADHEAGIEVETRAGAQGLPVSGQAQSNDTRTITIDGRDMFFAFRVTQLQQISQPRKQIWVAMHHGRGDLQFAGLNLMVRRAADGSVCRTHVFVAGDESIPLPSEKADKAVFELPLPLSDGHGGLFISVELGPTAEATCDAKKVPLTVTFRGSRLATVDPPHPRVW